jgi:predicted kinase
MKSRTKQCITFAGAAGSSKTPIASYLSSTLNLPVFSNDAIRTEVTEDLLGFDKKTYDERQQSRCKSMLATGNSFIYDASVDRKWSTLDDWLKQEDYRCFIISLDLTYSLLAKLYAAKNYVNTPDLLEKYIEQHQAFLAEYNQVVGLHITDANFADRLSIAHEHVSNWLDGGHGR